MAVNNFKTFCPTDTGTNLESVTDYTADADRTSGNKPGVASGKLNNRALRQANYIASQTAQYISNTLNQDVLDVDGGEAALLKQITAVFTRLSPSVQRFLSGSGTYNLSYKFFVTAANATAGATYSDGVTTFTVKDTIVAGTILRATGSADPVVSGTLTKTAGSGDATITFSAFRKPVAIEVQIVGSGGGGAGGGTTGITAGGNGGNTTFGSNVASGGVGAAATGGSPGGAGGTVTLVTGVALTSVAGGKGSAGQENVIVGSSYPNSGAGGAGVLGGAGSPSYNAAGGSPSANSGAGGAGGGISSTVALGFTGAGGGAGATLISLISDSSLASSFSYAVGSGGSAGGAGSNGYAGSAGADGLIVVKELYQ